MNWDFEGLVAAGTLSKVDNVPPDYSVVRAK